MIENKNGVVGFCQSTKIIVSIGNFKKTIFCRGCFSSYDKDIENRYNLIEKSITEIIFNKVEIKKMAKHDMQFL